MKVANIICRFGYARGNATFLTISDLSLDDRAVGFIEQRPGVIAHHQQRHQILKHGAGPGNKRASAIDGGQLATEPEPVFLWHFPLGDGDEAGQARFRSKQIVVRVVRALGRDVVADRKHLPLRIEEKLKIHFFHDLFGGMRQTTEPRQKISCRAGTLLERRGQFRERFN